MDHIDSRILWNFDRNARAPLTEIAAQVGITKQLLNYRLKKLMDGRIITGFLPLIDIHHLGFMTFRIYFRYRNIERFSTNDVISYFVKHSHTLWVASIEGIWDLEVVFCVRNFVHLNNIFKKMQNDLGRFFQRYNISMSPVCYQFRRDYLVGSTRKAFTTSYYGFEPKPESIDRNAYRVLTRLSKDCRASVEEISKKLGLAYQTVRQRIELMEELNVIQGYRALLNLTKIGRRYYKALLKLENLSENKEKALYSYCGKYSFVMYLTEVLGDWQLEIECEVEDSSQLTKLLRDLRQNFPENVVDYDLVEVTNEHKINYFPMGDLAFDELHKSAA